MTQKKTSYNGFKAYRSDLRAAIRSAILKAVETEGPATFQAVVLTSKTTYPTCKKYLAELLNEGIVEERTLPGGVKLFSLATGGE